MNALPTYNTPSGATEGTGQSSTYFSNGMEPYGFGVEETPSALISATSSQGSISGSTPISLSAREEIKLLEGLADIEAGRYTELNADDDLLSFLKQ